MTGRRHGPWLHFGCLGFGDFKELLLWYINEKIQLYSFALDSSSNARTCSRFTLGKPSRKSAMESPAPRWSNRLLIGTRVPAKTGSPPRISGARVTTFSMEK